MNIEINKFQIIQFIKMFSNNFKAHRILTDVRNKIIFVWKNKE